MPLLSLKAKELKDTLNNKSKALTKEEILKNLQENWDTATQGRWTHQFIFSIKAWVNRRHGEENFLLT